MGAYVVCTKRIVPRQFSFFNTCIKKGYGIDFENNTSILKLPAMYGILKKNIYKKIQKEGVEYV